MKKSLLFATFCCIFCISNITLSQEVKVSPTLSTNKTEKNELTSLKPADGHPAVFTTKEELASAAPLKIAKIKELINSGQNSDARIKVLREELWRFENAIVKE